MIRDYDAESLGFRSSEELADWQRRQQATTNVRAAPTAEPAPAPADERAGPILRELVEAKSAHERVCFSRTSRTIEFDPMASISGIGLKITSDPEHDDAVARLNAAWVAARAWAAQEPKP